MWIARQVEPVIRRMGKQFPALLVTGARQTGKTSLLRQLYPKAAYLTLDFPANTESARTAPEELLAAHPPPVIIDEIQYAPSLLRHLKARIDHDRSPGQFLLTGSQVFPLMQGVAESLAGRCAIANLHTFARTELLASGSAIDRPGSAGVSRTPAEGVRRWIDESRYMFLGGYPELHLGVDADLWFPAYVATYLERDVRNVLRIADLPEFNRFLRACALRTSQMVNYSDLARDTGIAPNTARKWVGLLETSGIVAIIEPYFANRTKRLIKTPKLVFLDTGLAAFLAGFRSERELTQSPLVGAFWESHVIGQLIRLAASRAMSDAICYWRTAGGQEVDIVIERAGDVTAIECKWGENPRASDAHGLNALEAAEHGKVKEKIIVCRTQASYRLPDGTWVMNTLDALKRLAPTDDSRGSRRFYRDEIYDERLNRYKPR